MQLKFSTRILKITKVDKEILSETIHPRKSYANFETVFDVFVEIMDRIALLRPPSEEENRYESMIYLRLIQTRVLTHRTLYKSGIQVMYIEIP